MKLKNKNAIVTGGSHGLGRAIVQRFVEEGANVVLCAREEQSLARIDQELKFHVRSGQRVISQKCDVSSNEQVEAMFETTGEELGELHILVNNAGVYGPKGPAEEVDWDATGYNKLSDPWRDDERIMVAEYFTRDELKKPILLLSDQSVVDEAIYAANKDTYDALGVSVVGMRESRGFRVTQRIMTGAEILETNT